MLTCPRCQQSLDSETVTCPYCQATLKAFGHPGIPLHQQSGEGFLCDQCLYHQDDTCNFPQRPYAKTCILFQDKSLPLITSSSLKHDKRPQSLKAWLRKNHVVLLLLGLILISLLWAITR